MKTVGQVLSQAREKNKLTIEQLSERTHIQKEFLLSIESDMFERLPSDVSARGFISLISQEVGLDAQAVLALYRRDVRVVPKDLTPIRSRFWAVNQRKLSRMLLTSLFFGVLLGAGLFAVLFVFRLYQAPPLKILAPADQSTVISPFVLRGSSTSDAVIMIDGEAIGIDQDGLFASEQNLSPGLHVLTIRAKGRNGKERVYQLTVTVREPNSIK